MGRLEDIVERNTHPGKHRKSRFPMGLAVAVFVLLILVLMIFTDLDESGDTATSPPPSTPSTPNTGEPSERRVRGIELRSPRPRTPADARDIESD